MAFLWTQRTVSTSVCQSPFKLSQGRDNSSELRYNFNTRPWTIIWSRADIAEVLQSYLPQSRNCDLNCQFLLLLLLACFWTRRGHVTSVNIMLNQTTYQYTGCVLAVIRSPLQMPKNDLQTYKCWRADNMSLQHRESTGAIRQAAECGYSVHVCHSGYPLVSITHLCGVIIRASRGLEHFSQ